jgi:hypothetical protein
MAQLAGFVCEDNSTLYLSFPLGVDWIYSYSVCYLDYQILRNTMKRCSHRGVYNAFSGASKNVLSQSLKTYGTASQSVPQRNDHFHLAT